MIMYAFEEEMKIPVTQGEGPFGLVICPSRELAHQTHDVLNLYSSYMEEHGSWPHIKNVLLIGGEDSKAQLSQISGGVHNIVATPGRLQDMLNRKKFSLGFCRCVWGNCFLRANNKNNVMIK